MRRIKPLVIVAALAFVTASVAAQANLAGKWTHGSGLRSGPAG